MTERILQTRITDLELNHRPSRLPPKPYGLRLSLMKATDIPLHFYRYLYWEIGRDWLWTDRHNLPDEELSRRIHKDGVEVSLLYLDGTPAGYYELDYALMPQVHLVYFGLMRRATGRAIGPWLLGCAVSEAFDRDAHQLTVNTCTLDHPKALPMYQKIGFQPIAQRSRKVEIPDSFTIPDHIANLQA